jgi:glutaredoxin-related protein
MKKFIIAVVALTVFFAVAGSVFLGGNSSSSTPTLPTSYEYFWGEGCPHCANVEEFFSAWEGKDKVSVDKKEVSKNRQNALLMRERAAYCNLPSDNLGVPFLFTPEGKCITGDEPIIEYFKGLNL